MNSDPTDQKLQCLFDGSRAEDARRAPAFGEIVSDRRTAPRTAIRWRCLVAAAAALAMLGASLALLHRRSAPEPAVDLRQWEVVSAWRASTDSLLTTSSLSLDSWISTPTDSLINAVSGETDTTSDKGKEAL